MTLINCKNCGAPLTPSGRCEYCGSRFELDSVDCEIHLEVDLGRVAAVLYADNRVVEVIPCEEGI